MKTVDVSKCCKAELSVMNNGRVKCKKCNKFCKIETYDLEPDGKILRNLLIATIVFILGVIALVKLK